MLTLKGKQVYLRALEPEDLDFLYHLENDETVWEISETQTPYSKYVLKKYLKNSHKDIFEVKQLRLAIVNYKEVLLGFVDIYDFNPKNSRAGVGIVVFKDAHRKKGYGTEALQLIVDYAFYHLNLHQLFANISTANKPSIRLFSNAGFVSIGIKKDWNYRGGTYNDEILFQKIKKQ